jgi:hypothetical protein
MTTHPTTLLALASLTAAARTPVAPTLQAAADNRVCEIVPGSKGDHSHLARRTPCCAN